MMLDHAAAWAAQNGSLADLLRNSDPETPVPSCPGWTLRQLGTHVGRGDRWAAAIVAQAADSFVDPRTVPDGKPPADDPAAAAAWLVAGVPLLAEAVATTGVDTPVWTFLGPRPAAWWLRRRLHEALVHHADAALAVGAPFEVPAQVAADGVAEWLSLVTARPAGDEPLLVEGATMHLHATDGADAGAPHDAGLGLAGEWMVRPDGSGIAWEPGHAKGTVAVRGAAVDLLLALVRRIPADDQRVQVLGDATVFDTWLARTSF